MPGEAEQVPEETAHFGKERVKACAVVLIENAETDDDNDLVVDVHRNVRDLFERFLAEFLLDENKHAEIQSPDDEVPARAVPETGGKPDEEQTHPLSALSEDRNVKQIIAEEASERNVPALPELLDGTADKRIVEVFVEMEAENASHTDGHVGIAREVEIDLHGIGDDTDPCGKDRSRIDRGGQIKFGKQFEVIGDDDLFPQTDEHTGKALGQIGQTGMTVVNLFRDGGVTDDRSGDKLGEQRDVKQQLGESLLNGDVLPIHVDDVGKDLERVEADTER